VERIDGCRFPLCTKPTGARSRATTTRAHSGASAEAYPVFDGTGANVAALTSVLPLSIDPLWLRGAQQLLPRCQFNYRSAD
jgi:hypothetical protein